MKILVVEDDLELLRTVLRYLDSFGCVCEGARSLADGLEKTGTYQYDCVVLDVNLPDGSGLDMLESVRLNQDRAGVLILSARDTLDDRIRGLDSGADDYLTKPFHLAELNARIRSIVRRKHFDGSNTLELGSLRIDTAAQEVMVNSERLKLTRKEYQLLLFLVSNRDKVVTKMSISEHIWGDYIDQADSFDFIYAHLKNLRKKIIDKGGRDHIRTVYGIGYKFSVNDAD